jgi:hypothetical protein
LGQPHGCRQILDEEEIPAVMSIGATSWLSSNLGWARDTSCHVYWGNLMAVVKSWMRKRYQLSCLLGQPHGCHQTWMRGLSPPWLEVTESSGVMPDFISGGSGFKSRPCHILFLCVPEQDTWPYLLLSTQEDTSNNWGGSLLWTSIPSRGTNAPSCLILQKPGWVPTLMSHQENSPVDFTFYLHWKYSPLKECVAAERICCLNETWYGMFLLFVYVTQVPFQYNYQFPITLLIFICRNLIRQKHSWLRWT